MSGAAELLKVARNLRKMDKRSDNLIPVWRKLGSEVARNNRRQFATKGAFYDTPWKPLKPRTMKQKLAGGWPRAPLVRTSDLRSQFTSRPMQVEKYLAHHAEFGSDTALAGWQHEGTFRNGRRAIPPRVLIKVNADLRAKARKMVAQYVLSGKR